MTFSVRGLLPARFRGHPDTNRPADDGTGTQPSKLRRFFARRQQKDSKPLPPLPRATPPDNPPANATFVGMPRNLHRRVHYVSAAEASALDSAPFSSQYAMDTVERHGAHRIQCRHLRRTTPFTINPTSRAPNEIPNDGNNDDDVPPLAGLPDLRNPPTTIQVTNASTTDSGPVIPAMPHVAFCPTPEIRQLEMNTNAASGNPRLLPAGFDPNAPSSRDPIIPRQLTPRTAWPHLPPGDPNLQPVLPGQPLQVMPVYNAFQQAPQPPPGQRFPVIPWNLTNPANYYYQACPPVGQNLNASPYADPQACIGTPGLGHHLPSPLPSPLATPSQPFRPALPTYVQVAEPTYPGINYEEEPNPCVLFANTGLQIKPIPDPRTFGERELTLAYEIGRGSFGAVMQGRISNNVATGVVAIKVLDKVKLATDQVTTADEGLPNTAIINEFRMQRKVTSADSKFLVPLLASILTPQDIYFVMPLYSSSLQTRLRRLRETKSTMAVAEAGLKAAQLLLGLEALHNMNIHHCDIKPENIFISPTGNIALGDFGLATEVAPGAKVKGFFGTAQYCAPEVWSDFVPAMADIWSFGAVVLQMLLSTDEPYFTEDPHDRDEHVLVRHALRHHPEVTPVVLDFLSTILNTAPAYRPTISQIKQHPFFSTTNWHIVNNLQYNPLYLPEPPMPLKSAARSSPPVELNQDHVRAIDAQLKALDDIDFNYTCPPEQFKRRLTQF